jgi:hypothetical protein
MGEPWYVDSLELVGYADVLDPTMLPSVVPPVFRVTAEPNRVLVPPYSFACGYLCNATEIDLPELEDLRGQHEVTLFDAAMPARPDYDLWIDQSYGVHYEEREQAERALRAIADQAVGGAENAFQRGDHAVAERLCWVAISADDRRIESLALRAAIGRLEGNSAGGALMEELAGQAVAAHAFRILVDEYCARVAGQPRRTTPGTDHRPMRGVAAMKPAA